MDTSSHERISLAEQADGTLKLNHKDKALGQRGLRWSSDWNHVLCIYT